MLKNIIKSYKLIKQSNFQIIRNLTSKNNADLEDEFKYQNDESTGIRNLEKLGIAKFFQNLSSGNFCLFRKNNWRKFVSCEVSGRSRLDRGLGSVARGQPPMNTTVWPHSTATSSGATFCGWH